MAIIEVADKDFEEKVIKSQLPVLVDFWASWCAPCRMAEPILHDVSEEYKGKLTVAKVNVDENKTTASKFGIMSIPTTILFKAGKEIGREVGFSGKDAFIELVKKGVI